MAETTDDSRARREAAALFPRPYLAPPPTCARCQGYARRRDTATGPLRGTVVTDMQVLMRRCAQDGHQ
ncbi:hypothetical protein [Streptomyces antimicrobicus]|uniref:Uncharacterized protein n=1 Tax=Streptomyces antimicrobicus TaxID=2883108 RepID=A0ABS8BA61_9ACTN|nr:hypothetical protein [Streptomyces antimicrobicus]MCB5181513.1 hypothetical protein [Streptomyces antimicrobicus]